MKFSAIKLCALVGLAGLILMGFRSHGHARPVVTANNKVVIYPTATESIDQLNQKGITNARNYGSYWLVEATDAQVAELTKLYGARAVNQSRMNRIELSAGSIDTTAGVPTVPKGFQQVDGPGKRLRLVQFHGPVTPEWLRSIKSVSNLQVISYVPNNAYLVQLDDPAETKLRAMEGPGGPIQWIGPYHPYYKIQRGLLNALGDSQELIDVRVALVGGTEAERALDAVREFGLIQGSYEHAGEAFVRVTVPLSAIPRIAQLPDVLWIEKVERKVLLDEVQGLILAEQTNAPGFGPATNAPAGVSAFFTNYVDFLTNTVGGGLASFIDPSTYPVVDVADTGLDVFNGLFRSSFYVFGERTNQFRVAYEEPPNGGYFNGASKGSGCTALNLNFIGTEDFYNHGTRVASVISGYDTHTNDLSELSIFSTIVTQMFTGTSTCVGTNTQTNTFTFGTAPCPLVTGLVVKCANDGDTVTTNLALATELIVTQVVDFVHQDPSGFHFGLGVSPFGRIGSSRIWQQDADTTGTPPHARLLPPGQPLIPCMDSLYPVLFDAAYSKGARIQNNSWAAFLDVRGANGGRYTIDSQTFDTAVRDALLVGQSNNVPGPSPLNQEFIVVFAAVSFRGDEGVVGGGLGGIGDIRITDPATAKNVITVGSSENVRLDGSGCAGLVNEDNSLDMWEGSEFGPTLDGRFKPEIVAPGTTIYAAKSLLAVFINSRNEIAPTIAEDPNGNLGSDVIFSGVFTNLYCDPPTNIPVFFTNTTATAGDSIAAPGSGEYDCDSGSSYAAPAVSGAIQLLWWYFQHRLTNEVGQALLQPSPAMAKAYVCNSARYLPVTNPQTGAMDTLPSIAQGMGELDLATMFDGVGRAIRDESSPRAIDAPLITTNPAPQQTYFSQSGQSYEVSGQIASNGLPFRVTLAWTDAPGQPATDSQQQLVNDLDLEVHLNGVTYKGNVFAQNVSVPGGGPDPFNNMESVFLNPTGWLGGIPAVTSGAPWQVIVRASNIAGSGVPNVGGPLNQDFALVIYNADTNTLSDVPNLATNNACQTAMEITNFPFAFANILTNTVYGNVHPSPSVARGGFDEFFKLPLPAAGTVFTIDTFGSDFDTVLSVWSVQEVPQTVLVRGDCGALTELTANDNAGGRGASQVSFTADGLNTYFIVAEGKNGAMGHLVLNVNQQHCITQLTPATLPSASPGANYGAQLDAIGGTAPFTFTVTKGSLPPGLTLDSTTGEISGIPTALGSFTFTITVIDAHGCSLSTVYTIAVTCPTVTLSPPALPSASIGQVYSQAITASGGQPPTTFSLAVGPLPPGLVLTNVGTSGVVTGTPTAPGVFTFKVQAADTNSCPGTAFYTISVICPTITISPSLLPLGTEGVPYTTTNFTATGGTPPYTFSQTAGSLPAGMTISSSGTLSGTPVSVSSTFTVTATDANKCTGSRTYTLTLDDPPLADPSISVGPATLPNGLVSQFYNSSLNANGGTSPYTFAVISNSLPPGLSLSTAGAITGTPTATGAFSFRVEAIDDQGHGNHHDYTINVSSLADLSVSALFTPNAVTVQSNLTCTIVVTNLGPSSATGVTVSNTLPAGATFGSASTGCAVVDGALVCDIGNLPVGGGVAVSYVVQPTVVGAIGAVASVTGNDPDPNSANNRTTASGTVKPPYIVASTPKSIVDEDGDIVGITLKGAGAMEVRVLGGDNQGPIDQIVLTGTDASSSLTIQVKKGKAGNGVVNIGSIVGAGSLKTINGKALNVTGAGIQLGGSLGTLKANALLNSAIAVGGSIGTVQLHEMSNSTCSAGGPIKTVNVKVYTASTINALQVGSVKLGSVNTTNGNQQFGVQVQQPGGTVSVSSPRLKWKITTSSDQSAGDFHVIQ